MANDLRLLIIDGPSAVGKSTLVNILLKSKEPKFVVAKRVTTRKKRKSDEDSFSYDFISMEKFNEMINSGELIEYFHYLFGMSYGLPKKNVLDLLDKGENVLGMINLGNARMVKKHFPNSFCVFISADISTIEARLRARGIHTEEQIQERLGNAKKAEQFKNDYDLIIKTDNEPPEETVSKIINAFLNYQINNSNLISTNDFRNQNSLLALYSAVQNDVAYYRSWEWHITAYYALLSTGIIGIVTSSTINKHIDTWHLWGLTIVQSVAIVLSVYHLIKVHKYLSWNRALRNKIEQLLGFFEEGIYFPNITLLPKKFNNRNNYFLFELSEFVFPFILVLIAYELFTLYLIWNS